VKTRSIPLGTYPSGSIDRGPFAFPNGLNGFDIRIGRCTTVDPTIWSDPTTIITIDMQFSYDGGTTYTAIGANSWSGGGGILSGRDGEVAETVLTWEFHPAEPTHAKARLTVANGPVKTYLDVTINT
jgi:hypothetical protein